MKNITKILATLAVAAGLTANGEVYDLSTYKVSPLTLQDGDTLIGEASGAIEIRITSDATVTLENVTINREGVQSNDTKYPGIWCGANVTLLLSGENLVRGFSSAFPCIFILKDKTLTIKNADDAHPGTLNAIASDINGAAAIGACALNSKWSYYPWGGNIVIESGTIYAQGGNIGGAGIGAGCMGGSCQNIEIKGGNVVAIGGGSAAGIGGGSSLTEYQGTKKPQYSSCGNITITGGIVEATGGPLAAGIGGGSESDCEKITIGNGIERVVATRGDSDSVSTAVPIGAGDKARCWGGVKIDSNLVELGNSVTRTISAQNYLVLGDVATDKTIKDNTIVTGILGNNVKLSIADGATVMFDKVTINGISDSSFNWAGITCEGDATIILRGENSVTGFLASKPGIFVPEGKTLTIDGTGSLVARNNVSEAGTGLAAGIGAGNHAKGGNVVINGGTVSAYGGLGCAGIGGAVDGKFGDITINGGTVHAYGGVGGPGLGSSAGSKCGNITIGLGVNKVVAVAGSTDADAALSAFSLSPAQPIGVAIGGKCGDIVVEKGLRDVTSSDNLTRTIDFTGVNLSTISEDVTVQDGKVVTGKISSGKAVKIADGATVTLQDVTIDGDERDVEDPDDPYAAKGLQCLGDATIILKGKNVVRCSGGYQSGIHVPTGKKLTITGDGELYASSAQGAGIGAGYNWNMGSCGDISIEGGTIVAEGSVKYGGAGIGSSFGSICGEISITGGNVTAIGHAGAAGIGCGTEGYCGDIIIGAGIDKVVATAGDEVRSTNDDHLMYKAGEPIGLSGEGQSSNYNQSTCGTVLVPQNDYITDTTEDLTRTIERQVTPIETILSGGTTIKPMSGMSIVGKTTKTVVVSGNSSVKINGIEVSGEAAPAPEFDSEGTAETTEFVQDSDGTWTLTTFAELNNASIGEEVEQSQIKVYSAESLEGLATADPLESGNVTIKEKKSAVMTKIKVTPPTPTPGVKSRFFRVDFGK